MGSSVRAKDVAEEQGDTSPRSPLRQRRISTHSDRSSRRSQHLLNPVVENARYASIRALLQDFCARTSSHGIPFIGCTSFFGRFAWILIFVVCFSLFSFQTYWTLNEYFQYRTIIEMQLKFEPAPFPAATVCNLNAFKISELRNFDEISQGIALWERAMNKASDEVTLKAMVDELEKDQRRRRIRREVFYQAVFVRCNCLTLDDQCVPQRNPLQLNSSVCLCFEDRNTGNIWPCYPSSVWTEKLCDQCSISNTCLDPDRPNATQFFAHNATTCLCQSISHSCVKRLPGSQIKWWDPHSYTVYPATAPTTPLPEIEEAFGLKDLKDKGALTTKTKENLIFLVAGMPKEVRQNLSYTLHEFVLRCSFNSEDCNLERDFQLHMDPEYGNCYTFNFNDS